MDRSDWIKAKRSEAEERYDTLWAPLYGETVGVYRNATHRKFLAEFLGCLPAHSIILDAACGAGRYMPLLLEAGYSVVGIDQSQGMLSRARALYPSVQLHKVGLQEMDFEEAFDGAICIDAMEHVFPEDWLPRLRNFQRALKPLGYLYFTVEMATAGEIKAAFLSGRQMGLPLVEGEWADEDVYHYYPGLEQVRAWAAQAGLEWIDEGEGDGYHHCVVRRAPARSMMPCAHESEVAPRVPGQFVPDVAEQDVRL